MTRADEYRAKLRTLDHWDSYLLEESGLPGPRGNIELAQVVADEGTQPLFQRYIAYTADRAPTNSPYEFLAFCGLVGLGRLLAEGDEDVLKTLRFYASDPRWRIREAVAMALQRLGDVNMERLVTEMYEWSRGVPLEQRAAAAAVCEPRLLGQTKHAWAALQIGEPVLRTRETLSLRQEVTPCAQTVPCVSTKPAFGSTAWPRAGVPRRRSGTGTSPRPSRVTIG
jgi:hypothetical protein